MTEKEFAKMIRDASAVPPSPFSVYCLELSGYDITYHGRSLDKWELWHIEKDVKKLINTNGISVSIKQDLLNKYRKAQQIYKDNPDLFTYEQSLKLNDYAKFLIPSNIKRYVEIVRNKQYF